MPVCEIWIWPNWQWYDLHAIQRSNMGETPHLFLQVQQYRRVSQPRCTAFIKYRSLHNRPYSEVTLLLKKVIFISNWYFAVLTHPYTMPWSQKRFNVVKSRICCKQKNVEMQKWCGLEIGHGVKKKGLYVGSETMVSESLIWTSYYRKYYALSVYSLHLWHHCMKWLQNLTILDLKCLRCRFPKLVLDSL